MLPLLQLSKRSGTLDSFELFSVKEAEQYKSATK